MKLLTFDERRDRRDLTICDESQELIVINEFSLTHLKWRKDPIFPKKHQDFHGCIMNIGIFDHTSFFRSYSRNNQVIMNEWFVDFIEAVSQRLNFLTNGFICNEFDCSDYIDEGTFIYNILTISAIESVHMDKYRNGRLMSEMMNIECT